MIGKIKVNNSFPDRISELSIFIYEFKLTHQILFLHQMSSTSVIPIKDVKLTTSFLCFLDFNKYITGDDSDQSRNV